MSNDGDLFVQLKRTKAKNFPVQPFFPYQIETRNLYRGPHKHNLEQVTGKLN